MARNRVIYQSEALYTSKNIASQASGEHFQLRRVQSANYNFSIDRKDVNQFGQLARIDALVLKSPTVGLDFSYYPTDGLNEKALGFYVRDAGIPIYRTGNNSPYTGPVATGLPDETTTPKTNVFSGYQSVPPEGNFASGQMGASSGQNFYIVTTDEGQDLNTTVGASAANPGAMSGKNIIAIGNGFLSNYTLDASVGNLPTVKITIEGLNMQSSTILGTAITGTQNGNNLTGTGNMVIVPSVDPTNGSSKYLTGGLKNPSETTGAGILSALRPGDLTLSFGDYETATSTEGSPIASLTSLNVQSASLSLPLSRTPIERLGSRFAYARVVDFPIVATLNVSSILSDVQARNLSSMLDDSTKRDVTLTIKKPGSTDVALAYSLKGTLLKSESFSSSIGSNKTVDLVFETQIGGPSDTKNGVYVSGSYTYADWTSNVSGTWAY